MLVPTSRNVVPSGRPSRGMGELPEGVSRACLEWQPNTGMQVDPDGYLWRNGVPLGVKECKGGLAPQDAVITIYQMDAAVLQAFRLVKQQTDRLISLEQQVQGLCRTAQDMEEGAGYRFPRPMAPFVDLWNEAQGVLTNAESAHEIAVTNWEEVNRIDAQYENAYTIGRYNDPAIGTEVMSALQGWNHVPIAWDNIHVAAACVKEALDYWINVCWNEADSRFQYMSTMASMVAATYDDVQRFLAALNADAERVTLSQQAADAIAAAKPSMDALNEMASQIGVLYQQAQVQHEAALKGTTDGAPVATEWARYWLEEAFGAFWGAADRASQYAADIHEKLDATAKQLREYVVQHPELPAASSSSSGKGVLVLGGVALLALIAKKAALFA